MSALELRAILSLSSIYALRMPGLFLILPSLVSRVAPPAAKGAALGVYNTMMSFGLFAGGALGGYLAGCLVPAVVFEFGAAMMLLWFIVVFGARVPGRRAPAITQHEGELKHGLSQ